MSGREHTDPPKKSVKSIDLGTPIDLNDFYLRACVLKRNPDPGVCFVVALDMEEKRAALSNGAVRFTEPFSNLVFMIYERKEG